MVNIKLSDLSGNRDPKEFSCKAPDGSSISPDRAIVPVFRQNPITQDFALVGTAFFIAQYGLIMSAKHVLKDVIDKNNQCVAAIGVCHFLEDNKYLLRTIRRGYWQDDSDIAMAVLDQPSNQQTGRPLMNNILKLSGKSYKSKYEIFTCAYPSSEIKKEHGKTVMRFGCSYYSGRLVEEYPNGRDRSMIPNPCWRTDMHIHPAASGGPVIDEEGRVMGVNASSHADEPNLSYISTLSHLTNLRINKLKIPGQDRTDFTFGELIKLGIIDMLL